MTMSNRLTVFQKDENQPTGTTIVVGMKLDTCSKQLLTWALLKLAQPGDRVLALHVLNSTELLDQDGQASVLNLVKAFESVLAVYEGFCSLQQVDLKLKICRGSSVRKVLAREAKAFAACKLILGIAKIASPVGSSVSIARYCSRKLPSECCVYAVSSGKVVFQREGTPTSENRKGGPRWNANFFNIIHRTRRKSSKYSSLQFSAKRYTDGHEIQHNDSQKPFFIDENPQVSVTKQSLEKKCLICSPKSLPSELQNLPCDGNGVASNDSDDHRSTKGLITNTVDSIVPEMRHGWPLLRRSIWPSRRSLENSTGQPMSVVQWAMRLPNRDRTTDLHLNKKSVNLKEQTLCILTGKSGAMVLDGDCASPHSGVINCKSEKNVIPSELESLCKKHSSTCKLFCYQELVQATSNFSTENLVGKGGSSQVYKGYLPDGKELAVKILKPSEDVVKEFILEIKILTTLTHKNIISLFGFCFEGSNLLLVFEFLTRGSLEENLHGKKNKQVLGWEDRYKVALGVAHALDYLHSRDSQPIIHRDVKSSNILLAEDFQPQLSDFGLANWASRSSTDVNCSDVAGTFGYLAPEYFMYGKVTDRIDVYAFGVVLLELLSGRKPISDEYPKGQQSLVMWAMPLLRSEKSLQLLDPSLGNMFDKEQVENMVLAACLCVRRTPRFRPRMSTILNLLQGDEEATKWAKTQVGSPQGFDGLGEESFSTPDIQSHINLALLDVEYDSASISSTEPSIHNVMANESMEDYLQGRWSRPLSLG